METAPTFNKLCKACQNVFSSIRIRDKWRTISEFHDIAGFFESAEEGCHFCNILLNSIRNLGKTKLSSYKPPLQLNEANKAKEAKESGHDRDDIGQLHLEAEVRYFMGVAISFILRMAGGDDDAIWTYIDFALGEAPAEMVSPTNSRTEHGGTMYRLAKWIDDCNLHHTSCRSSRRRFPGGYPTRLLFVGSSNYEVVRLCEGGSLDKKPEYIALSYCWGNLEPSAKLLTSTYSSFLINIPQWQLPYTYNDAIKIARELRIHYLWIDSLCIFQDNKRDWDMEACRMHIVYSNSWLTLVAAAAENLDSSIFRKRNPLSMVPCTITLNAGGKYKYATTAYEGNDQCSKISTLADRAWAFQERLLAPRAVLFTKTEIFWECESLYASEVFPKGNTGWVGQDSCRQNVTGKLREDWGVLDEKTPWQLWMIWNRVVTEYSSKRMRRPTDKLAAIAGLAFSMQRAWITDTPEYLAGLWSYRLDEGLLWSSDGQCVCPDISRAPSWSWASLDGKVNTHKERPSDPIESDERIVDILDAQAKRPPNSGNLGHTYTGHVRLLGILGRFRIIQHDQGDIKTSFDIELSPEKFKGRFSHFRQWVPARIAFDDSAMNVFPNAEVFLMPFRLKSFKASRSEKAKTEMQGLVLASIEGERGRFRRLGHFEIVEEHQRSGDDDGESSSTGRATNTMLGAISPTGPAPEASDDDYDMERPGSPQGKNAAAKKVAMGESILRSDAHSFRSANKTKKQRKDLGGSSSDKEDGQSLLDAHSLRHDQRRWVDNSARSPEQAKKRIRARYRRLAVKKHPGISSFLSMISRQDEKLAKKGVTLGDVYLEDHGHGVHTIEIV